MTPLRIIAIDWSGAKTAAAKKIWIAEARDGDLLFLENGRSREVVTDWLIDAARRDRLVVGLDFAFSTPRWFLDERGLRTAHDLWRAARESADSWLRDCEYPLWGRPGKKCLLDDGKRFRRSESGTSAKSVFQIGGAGAVGTGSFRGMATLCALHEAGFTIWPFDDPDESTSMALEIYPRVFTGPVRKSNESARVTLIEERYGHLAPEHRRAMASSDDAFDAAISALEMSRHADELSGLPRIEDPVLKLEGMIWRPGAGTTPPAVLAT